MKLYNLVESIRENLMPGQQREFYSVKTVHCMGGKDGSEIHDINPLSEAHGQMYIKFRIFQIWER